MVLSLLVNGALDLGFGVGWWIVKKVGSSIYDLGSNLFFERFIVVDDKKDKDEKEKEKRMETILEELEHDLVEIKHNQEIILHKLDMNIDMDIDIDKDSESIKN